MTNKIAFYNKVEKGEIQIKIGDFESRRVLALLKMDLVLKAPQVYHSLGKNGNQPQIIFNFLDVEFNDSVKNPVFTFCIGMDSICIKNKMLITDANTTFSLKSCYQLNSSQFRKLSTEKSLKLLEKEIKCRHNR